jgi:hypothetical protein
MRRPVRRRTSIRAVPDYSRLVTMILSEVRLFRDHSKSRTDSRYLLSLGHRSLQDRGTSRDEPRFPTYLSFLSQLSRFDFSSSLFLFSLLTLFTLSTVGRFVTVLRAFWSPHAPSIATPHIHVGNMRRALDLYLPDGTRVQSYSDEAITAVPAVTACHPTVPGKYFGGSASGKIAYFAEPL